MEFGDIIWSIIWLVTGYYIFKETSLKSFLDGFGIITMLFSLAGIVMEPELLAKFFMKLPISYFGGAVTHYFYLVGANFGRADHFGNDINWGRIILYTIIIAGLILFLNWLNPIIESSSTIQIPMVTN